MVYGGIVARYTDDFRASAVVMLEAAGYPDRKGALTQVAASLKISRATISRWYNHKRNPAPSELVNEKRTDLKELLENELRGALGEMADARMDASYRDLGTVVGILFDKKQLLEGKPTEIVDDNSLTDEKRVDRITAIFDRARDRRDRRPDEFVQ